MSCAYTIIFVFIGIMTATGFLIALINRKGKSDVSSIEISDMRTKYRTSDYLIVVETRIDLISHPTDIIYVRPILKKKKSWISADFLKKSEPNEALDGENGEVVWKLQFRVYSEIVLLIFLPLDTPIQPDHDQQFLSGSKFYFFVAAHKSVDIEKAIGCEVWIPFQGRTRVWTPKSITIRKMMISPDIVPPVGKLNDISYPILKFYFEGRISLIENFRLFAAKKIYFYPILLEFERAPDIPLEEMEKVPSDKKNILCGIIYFEYNHSERPFLRKILQLFH